MNVKHLIIGKKRALYLQMVQFVQKVNPNFNKAIAKAFIDIGSIYGIQGDIAFCQAIHETNWFRFTGDVKEEQNNFAGIGATGDGSAGQSFSSITEGVRAQIQHLFAYATTSELPKGEKLVDPRFNLVRRGSAPNWEDLAGKWAYPGYNRSQFESLEDALNAGKTYGQQIILLYNQLLRVSVSNNNQVKEEQELVSNGYPEGAEEWKINGVEWLFEEGLLIDDKWKEKINEPLPLWAQATIYNRLLRKMKG